MNERKITPIDNSLDNFMIWGGTHIFFGKNCLEHLPEGNPENDPFLIILEEEEEE